MQRNLKPPKAEVISYLRSVLERIDHLELLVSNDGLRKYTQMQIAAKVVAGRLPEFKLQGAAVNYDMSRALDAIAEFRPQHPIARDWKVLKRHGLAPKKRGPGGGKASGRNLIAVMLVQELVTLGYKPTRSRHSLHEESACDVVAEVLRDGSKGWATYDAVRNAWEKRKR